MNRWRVVVKSFEARVFAEGASVYKRFKVGEKLFIRTDDGAHVKFVRHGSGQEIFIAAFAAFGAATEVCESPEPNGK